jgi:hypothetical protein
MVRGARNLTFNSLSGGPLSSDSPKVGGMEPKSQGTFFSSLSSFLSRARRGAGIAFQPRPEPRSKCEFDTASGLKLHAVRMTYSFCLLSRINGCVLARVSVQEHASGPVLGPSPTPLSQYIYRKAAIFDPLNELTNGEGTRLMAKQKAPRDHPRPTALTTKGRPEWRARVERAAGFCRTDAAKLVDAALVEYLKQRGFDEPAPRRLSIWCGAVHFHCRLGAGQLRSVRPSPQP